MAKLNEKRLNEVYRKARTPKTRAALRANIFANAMRDRDQAGVDLVESRMRDVLGLEPAEELTPQIAARKFGYESYDDCLQDACSSAGGVWLEQGDASGRRGCYAPQGVSGKVRAAVVAAYLWGSAECASDAGARTIVGLIVKYWFRTERPRPIARPGGGGTTA